MGYWVYILHSESADKYYVGMSSDPVRRTEFHNSTEKGFTSRYRPWRLVYRRELATKKEAMAVERLIKARKRKQFIADLVAGKR